MKRKEFFSKQIKKYKKNLTLFAKEVLFFEPDEWQKEAFRDISVHGRVSVKSGQGVGKTSIEAIALLWFLSCFPFARVIATAPTSQQLHDILWSEVAKWQSKSPLLSQILKWTKTYVYMIGQEKRWFAVAKTATKPENMQGFHEDNMLFIVDEASGVSDIIMEVILGTLSGKNNKLLMCGNPTRTNGVFYDSHTVDSAMYRCHTVSSLSVERTNKENIHSLSRKYGRDSNVYRVRVLGEFPLADNDAFITLSSIGAAINKEPDIGGDITFGVDVARYGSDKTVIAVRQGNRITIPITRHGQNLMQTVGDIVNLYRKVLKERSNYRGRITVYVDDTGLGGGVTDRLEEVLREEHLRQMEIIPINFGARVPDKDDAEHYDNTGTWLWGNLREMLRENTLSFPNDTELVAQLSSRRYTLTSSGRITLESKDAMKKRGLPSPDRGDAVVLACYRDTSVLNIRALNS